MYSTQNMVKQIKLGNQQAFQFMYNQFQPQLVRFSRKFVQQEDTARELAQNVFIKVWKNRRNLKDTGSFQAYLYKIARNESFKHQKMMLKETMRQSEIINQMQTAAYSLADDYMLDNYQSVAEKAIAQLPPKRRLVFEMVQEGLSHEAIARELGISIHTVHAQVLKATQSIKQFLVQQLGISIS